MKDWEHFKPDTDNEDWKPKEPQHAYLKIPIEQTIKLSVAEMYMLLNENERTRSIWTRGRQRILQEHLPPELRELEPIKLKRYEHTKNTNKRHTQNWDISEIEFLQQCADELTYADMASCLNRSVESVKARLRRLQGRKK